MTHNEWNLMIMFGMILAFGTVVVVLDEIGRRQHRRRAGRKS
ncbi:MAG: hypothetical protein ABL986_14070 [Vicinamibacterales bacterium]